MEAKDIIEFIRAPMVYDETSRDSVTLPWDIAPHEYLRFAQKDAEGMDKRSIVNALSNAKRALECQLDSLLLAFELGAVGRQWNVPKKLDTMKRLGIVTPRILAKINRHRNEMEHEYSCPKHEVVADFVDVVALFLDATKVYIYDRRCEWSIEPTGDKWGKGASMNVNLGKKGLSVSYDEKTRRAPKLFPPDDGVYCDILGAIISSTDPTAE